MEVGEIPTGITPKEVVYKEDKLVLYRYKSEQEATNKTPLLIVYALVNRPYMADLQEKPLDDPRSAGCGSGRLPDRLGLPGRGRPVPDHG